MRTAISPMSISGTSGLIKVGPAYPVPVLDVIHADATHDGTSGDDVMYGRVRTSDRMYGDGGNDTMYSGGGVDKLYGGSGNDTLIAEYVTMSDHPRSKGTTLLDGGSGDDTLIVAKSGVGSFSLVGGTGDDTFIIRGHGQMTLAGGEGADTFTFESSFKGTATITDFEFGTDHFGLGGVRPQVLGEQNGDALLMVSHEAFVILDGVSAQEARLAVSGLFDF